MNDETLTNYLPIGTVVLLKKAKLKYMITGFKPIVNVDGKEKKYDYLGCVATIGIKTINSYKLFNKDQIDKVIYYGYQDDEWKEFKNKLESI